MEAVKKRKSSCFAGDYDCDSYHYKMASVWKKSKILVKWVLEDNY
jgi:hypothetical protein